MLILDDILIPDNFSTSKTKSRRWNFFFFQVSIMKDYGYRNFGIEVARLIVYFFSSKNLQKIDILSYLHTYMHSFKKLQISWTKTDCVGRNGTHVFKMLYHPQQCQPFHRLQLLYDLLTWCRLLNFVSKIRGKNFYSFLWPLNYNLSDIKATFWLASSSSVCERWNYLGLLKGSTPSFNLGRVQNNLVIPFVIYLPQYVNRISFSLYVKDQSVDSFLFYFPF